MYRERERDRQTNRQTERGLYNDWTLYSRIAFNKASIRWWLWVPAWFRGWSIITNSPQRPCSNLRCKQNLLDCHHFMGLPYSRWYILNFILDFFMHFLLSDGERTRLVKNAEVELVIKPRHATSIGNTLVIQLFFTYCSRRSSYFSNLRWCAQSKFSSKETLKLTTETFLV